MLTELEAVVRGEDEQRRFEQPLVAQRLDDPADAVVDRQQRLGVLADEAVEVGPSVVHPVDAVPAIPLRTHPGRLAGVVGVGVGHRRRARIARVDVGAGVALGRGERGVHRLVRQIQQERPVVVAPDELDGVVGQQVRRIAGRLAARPVDVQRRVRVRPLPAERYPVVEVRARIVAGAAHVPLADERGLVAGRLQTLWKGRNVSRHRGAVVEHLVGVRVLAGPTSIYMPQTVTGALSGDGSRRKIFSSHGRSRERSKTTRCPASAPQRSM